MLLTPVAETRISEFRAGGEGLRIQGHLVDDGNLRAAQASTICSGVLRSWQTSSSKALRSGRGRGRRSSGEVEENGAIGHQLYLSKSPGLVDNANLGLGVESGLCTGWNL